MTDPTLKSTDGAMFRAFSYGVVLLIVLLGAFSASAGDGILRIEVQQLRPLGYPAEVATWLGLLDKFPKTPALRPILQRLFEIANYWLDDTRAEMGQNADERPGGTKIARRYFHWNKDKPCFDEEDLAVALMEKIATLDPEGPLADDSLFFSGAVHFYRKNYAKADRNFSQIIAQHPKSPRFRQAIEMAIAAKLLHADRPKQRRRTLLEARRLVDETFKDNPDLDAKSEQRLQRQLQIVRRELSEIDFTLAESFERKGQPLAAWLGYQYVRWSYAGTPICKKAGEHLANLNWTDGMPKLESN